MYKVGDVVWLGDWDVGCPAEITVIKGDYIEARTLQRLNRFNRGDIVRCLTSAIKGQWSRDVIILVGLRKRNPYGFTNDTADIISLCEFRACRAPQLERRENVKK